VKCTADECDPDECCQRCKKRGIVCEYPVSESFCKKRYRRDGSIGKKQKFAKCGPNQSEDVEGNQEMDTDKRASRHLFSHADMVSAPSSMHLKVTSSQRQWAQNESLIHSFGGFPPLPESRKAYYLHSPNQLPQIPHHSFCPPSSLQKQQDISNNKQPLPLTSHDTNPFLSHHGTNDQHGANDMVSKHLLLSRLQAHLSQHEYVPQAHYQNFPLQAYSIMACNLPSNQTQHLNYLSALPSSSPMHLQPLLVSEFARTASSTVSCKKEEEDSVPESFAGIGLRPEVVLSFAPGVEPGKECKDILSDLIAESPRGIGSPLPGNRKEQSTLPEDFERFNMLVDLAAEHNRNSCTFTRLPADNSLVGTKSGLLLSKFMQRYTMLSPSFMGLQYLQSAIEMSSQISLPQSNQIQSMSEVNINHTANHLTLLAAVGLGACLSWEFLESLHQELKSVLHRGIALLRLSNLKSEEVIGAELLCKSYIKLMHKVRVDFPPEITEALTTSKGKLHTHLMKCFLLIEEKWIPSTKYIFQNIKQALFRKTYLKATFPVEKVIAALEGPELTENHKEVFAQLLCSSHGCSQYVHLMPATIPFQEVLANPALCQQSKCVLLEEALNFSKFVVAPEVSSPFASVFCHILKLALLMLRSEVHPAWTLLKTIADLLCEDAILCYMFLRITALSHMLHFICYACAHFQMENDYHSLQIKLNKAAVNLGNLNALFPLILPPVSESICEARQCKRMHECFSLCSRESSRCS